MIKRKDWSSRRVKYKAALIQLFMSVSRPLTTREIKDHTNTWRHGMTTKELTNLLAKDSAFDQSGSTMSGGLGGRYPVALWVLNQSEVEDMKISPQKTCNNCGAVATNIGSRLTCGKCYLAKKQRERRKNGKT